MVKCCTKLLREAAQPQPQRFLWHNWTQSRATWPGFEAVPALRWYESVSTGLFKPTLLYNYKFKLQWRISRWSDWKRGEEAGVGMGTVHVTEKRTEKCSSKGKEGKTFDLIFNKPMLGCLLLQHKKPPNILFPKYEEASLWGFCCLFLVKHMNINSLHLFCRKSK